MLLRIICNYYRQLFVIFAGSLVAASLVEISYLRKRYISENRQDERKYNQDMSSEIQMLRTLENKVTAMNNIKAGSVSPHSESENDSNSINTNTDKLLIDKFSSKPNCTPNYNVYYVKVHKTGSSTMSTLLERLVLRHDLRQLNVRTQPFYNHGSLTNLVSLYQLLQLLNACSVFKVNPFFDYLKLMSNWCVSVAVATRPKSK